MEYERQPRRYKMGDDEKMHPTFNGKLAEEFTDRDELQFFIELDLSLKGHITEVTLAAIKELGYQYKNGDLIPLQPKEADKSSIRDALQEAKKEVKEHAAPEVTKMDKGER